MSALDQSLFTILNSWAFVSPALDAIIVFFSVFLVDWMVAGVAAFILITYIPQYRDLRRKNIFLVGVALISALFARYIVTELIRFFYSRPRPFEALGEVQQLIFREGGGSFPSGHAAFSFAIAAVVGREYPKLGALFYTAAILLSFARVAAGVHWPADILGGAVIGVGTGLLAYAITKRFLPR